MPEENAPQNLLARVRGFVSSFGRSGSTDTGGIDRAGEGVLPPTSMPQTVATSSSGMMGQLRVDNDLMSRYVDYENMDDEPLIASGVDVYADDATQMDRQTQKVMWATSDDPNIQAEAAEVLDKRLAVNESAWEITRSLCKYGNDFERILVGNRGVVGLDYLSAPQTRRFEHKGEHAFVWNARGEFRMSDEDVLKALKTGDTLGPTNVGFEHWNVVHFRLRTKSRGARYGYGVQESARGAYKRLMMLEDSSIIHKVTRAPSRLAYYVNVGTKSGDEAYAFTNKVAQSHKTRRVVNPDTGQLELQPHIMAQNENIYVPVREGKDPTRIEVLQGSDYQSLELVEYFRNKLFAAMKIPRAYLSYDDNMPGRASLSAEDQKFARSELRIQREIIVGYRRILDVHFAALGYNPYSLNYGLRMTVPSAALELAQLEVEMTRGQLAQTYQEHLSRHWILMNVYGFDEKTTEFILAQRADEMKQEAAAQAAAFGQSAEDVLNVDRFMHDGSRELEKKLAPIIAKQVDIMGEKLGKDVRGSVQMLGEVQKHLKLMDGGQRKRDSILDNNFRAINSQLNDLPTNPY